jgi:hypothetical protein
MTNPIDYKQELYESTKMAGRKINALELENRTLCRLVDEISKITRIEDVDKSWALERIKFMVEQCKIGAKW